MAVPVSLPSGHRLDYEDMHKAEKKWNPVDTVNATRRAGVCRRPDTVVPQSSTDAGEDQ